MRMRVTLMKMTIRISNFTSEPTASDHDDSDFDDNYNERLHQSQQQGKVHSLRWRWSHQQGG